MQIVAERVDGVHRVAQLVIAGREVAAHHAGRAVAQAVDQGQVGGAVATLGVASDTPGRSRRLHPSVSGMTSTAGFTAAPSASRVLYAAVMPTTLIQSAGLPGNPGSSSMT